MIREYAKQVVHNAVAQHPLTYQLSSSNPPAPRQLSQVFMFSMTFYDMEYPFGQFGLVALPVFPPRFLWPTSLLAGRAA